MTNTTHALVLSLLVIGAAACGKADGSASYKPCDAKAITELSARLEKASPFGVDKSDKKAMAVYEAAKAKLTGKHYAFKGCTFATQGGDEIHFRAQGTDVSLGCVMKGGEAGVTKLRHGAMGLNVDEDKLRLDVSGVIGLAGEGDFSHLQLTGCSIAVHK